MQSTTESAEKTGLPITWQGIVKVQLSVVTTHDHRRVMIYNENRVIEFEILATEELIKRMGASSSYGVLKAFMYAERTEDGLIHLGEDAPWQSW